MTTTPPPQSPVCPPTPLWPAKYEHPREVRRSTRIAAGKPSQAEPSTPSRSDRSTPPPTIKKEKVSRSLFGSSSVSSSMNDNFSNLSTSMQTPKKKKLDGPQTPSSINRSVKTASRLQKFDLSSRNDSPIAIFEDSKDRIPGPIEDDEDDVFKPSTRQKRLKTAAAAHPDEPNPTDDGMIVVQRGRRSYKKFDDGSAFDGPMPRKKLFAEYTAAPVADDTDALPAIVDTDDEETEREDSPAPPARIVRFTEVSTSVTSSTPSDVMKTPGKSAVKSQTKTQFRTPKSHIEISNTSFLTPPATIQRDDVNSSFESVESVGRSSVKRKLSYNGPATPEATPAKKRSKVAGAGIGTPRDDEVFGTSPSRTRRAGKTHG